MALLMSSTFLLMSLLTAVEAQSLGLDVFLGLGIGSPPSRHPILDPQLLDFASAICGDYSNIGQINSGSTQHSKITVRVIPVKLNYAPFNKQVVLYFDYCVDNHLQLAHILLVVKDAEIKDTIAVIPFNFTHISEYSRCNQIHVNDLNNVKPEDLQFDPVCTIRFSKQSDGSYVAQWPDCRTCLEGRHPAYTVIITCSQYSSTVPLFSRERFATSPYRFDKIATYPLVYAPPGFKSFCDKLKSGCPLINLNLG